MEILTRALDQNRHGKSCLLSLPKLLRSYPQLFSACRWYPLLFQFGTREGDERFSDESPIIFFPANQQGAQLVYGSQHRQPGRCGPKDIPLREELRWQEGDFLQGTTDALPLLEGAWEYVTPIGTCPFLGYFLVLQKKVLRHHPPLQAPGISFSKACVEGLGKPALPQRTAQIHLLSLRVPGTEVRGSRYIITHLWSTLARVTRDAQCKFRSFFLSLVCAQIQVNPRMDYGL